MTESVDRPVACRPRAAVALASRGPPDGRRGGSTAASARPGPRGGLSSACLEIGADRSAGGSISSTGRDTIAGPLFSRSSGWLGDARAAVTIPAVASVGALRPPASGPGEPAERARMTRTIAIAGGSGLHRPAPRRDPRRARRRRHRAQPGSRARHATRPHPRTPDPLDRRGSGRARDAPRWRRRGRERDGRPGRAATVDAGSPPSDPREPARTDPDDRRGDPAAAGRAPADRPRQRLGLGRLPGPRRDRRRPRRTTRDRASSPTILCHEWEAAARAAEELGVRVAIVRNGFVIGPDAKALELLVLPFRLHVGGRLGSGRQWMSWVHVDDVVGIMTMAIDTPGGERPVQRGVAGAGPRGRRRRGDRAGPRPPLVAARPGAADPPRPARRLRADPRLRPGDPDPRAPPSAIASAGPTSTPRCGTSSGPLAEAGQPPAARRTALTATKSGWFGSIATLHASTVRSPVETWNV